MISEEKAVEEIIVFSPIPPMAPIKAERTSVLKKA